MKKISYQKSFGFTMIEIIVVLAVIGVLAAGLVPTIGKYLPGVQVNGSVRNLASDLRSAQESAVTSQDQHLVRFFSNAPVKYQIIEVKNSVEKVTKEVYLPANESITLESSITNNQIAFSPDGGPSSSGSVTLSINNISKIVNISPAGFIKIP